MKKVWVLIAMLLLSACGGSGNGAKSGSGDGGSDAGTTPTATVAILVNHSASSQLSAARKIIMAAPVATQARISITNPNVNGLSYKQIQDISIPGSTQLTVPIASGYTFELVTYTTGTPSPPNLIEEYALTQNVDIQAGSNTVTLTLNTIAVTISPPATLSTGQSYTVSYVSSLNPSPFYTTWRLKAQTTNYTKPLHLNGTSSATTSIKLTAPVNNNQSGTIYFQGEFFIKSSMLNSGEAYYNWAFFSPNPLWGDPALSAILLVPSGTVTISLP